jgi:peptidoglycan/LPS O-acetylase OafA/YrhL
VLVAYLERFTSAVAYLERHGRAASVMASVAVAIVVTVILIFPECRTVSGQKRWLGVIELALDDYVFSAAIAYLLLLSRATSGRSGRTLRLVLGSRVFTPFAQLSYSAYLLHPLCIAPLYAHFPIDFASPGLSYLRLVAVSLAASFVVAGVAFVTVEYPVMKLRPARVTSDDRRGDRA